MILIVADYNLAYHFIKPADDNMVAHRTIATVWLAKNSIQKTDKHVTQIWLPLGILFTNELIFTKSD